MNKNIFLAPLLGLLSTNILAGTMGDIRPPYSKVITISGELFLGIQKNASALVDYQLGLAVAVTSSAQLNGRSRDLSLTSLLELCRICTETNR